MFRYIRYFGGKTHPRLVRAKNDEAFLSSRTTAGKMAVSTQRQALAAIVFLYKHVLDMRLEEDITPVRGKGQKSPQTVMTHTKNELP